MNSAHSDYSVMSRGMRAIVLFTGLLTAGSLTTGLVVLFGKNLAIGWLFINVVLMYGSMGLSIFVHEIGHAIAARAAGYRIARIIFGIGPLVCSFRWLGGAVDIHVFPMQGLTFLSKDHLPESRLRACIAVAGGPMTQVVLILGSAVWLMLCPAMANWAKACSPALAILVVQIPLLFFTLWPSTHEVGGRIYMSDGAKLLLLIKGHFKKPASDEENRGPSQ